MKCNGEITKSVALYAKWFGKNVACLEIFTQFVVELANDSANTKSRFDVRIYMHNNF